MVDLTSMNEPRGFGGGQVREDVLADVIGLNDLEEEFRSSMLSRTINLSCRSEAVWENASHVKKA